MDALKHDELLEQAARLEAEAEHLAENGNPTRAAALRHEAAQVRTKVGRQKVPRAA